MKFPIITILLTLAITSCKTVQEQAIGNANGFWEQDGYGKIVEIRDSIIRVYDRSSVDCHLAFEEEILDFGRIKKVSKDSLVIKHNIDYWKFYRITNLPKLCLNSPKEKYQDPIYNFETFWHTFREHYCSFEIKNIDWDNVYKEYRPQITNNTSKLELFQIFERMTKLLNDDHVGLDLPDEIEDEYKQVQIKEENQYSKLDEFELHKKMATLYVDSLRNYNGGVVRWGMIGNDVGYVQFNTMWMMANYDIDPKLGLMKSYELYVENVQNIKDEVSREHEERGTDYIMNTILMDFQKAKSIILDLRFNGGGKDCVAIEIMNHFEQKNKKVASKHVKYKNSFAAYQDINVNPTPNNFGGKVIILTSHLTASAAEVAVLASLSYPNMERIGSRTEGIFSSTLDKTLPNGWEYEMSNEIYTDLKGNNYENQGIQPETKLDYPQDKDAFFNQLTDGINKKHDPAIELALDKLKK